MSLEGILLYCARAAGFAAAVCAVYALGCLLRKRKPRLKMLLGMAYIAALLQITVLRGGVDWRNLLSASRILRPVPLQTTLEELRRGAWPFIYHVIGNTAWFAPLGILLRRRGWGTALLAGAALSAGIETLQFLLATGVADVDDLILNAAGALAGWLLAKWFPAIKVDNKK